MSRFAIVTVIHDSARELASLLASVERQLASRPRVVVVDSGSHDGGAEHAREWGAEVVVLDANRGFGAANNAGLELVTEPVAVLVNPDVVCSTTACSLWWPKPAPATRWWCRGC